jgi:hypothetical protein
LALLYGGSNPQTASMARTEEAPRKTGLLCPTGA